MKKNIILLVIGIVVGILGNRLYVHTMNTLGHGPAILGWMGSPALLQLVEAVENGKPVIKPNIGGEPRVQLGLREDGTVVWRPTPQAPAPPPPPQAAAPVPPPPAPAAPAKLSPNPSFLMPPK